MAKYGRASVKKLPGSTAKQKFRTSFGKKKQILQKMASCTVDES